MSSGKEITITGYGTGSELAGKYFAYLGSMGDKSMKALYVTYEADTNPNVSAAFAKLTPYQEYNMTVVGTLKLGADSRPRKMPNG